MNQLCNMHRWAQCRDFGVVHPTISGKKISKQNLKECEDAHQGITSDICRKEKEKLQLAPVISKNCVCCAYCCSTTQFCVPRGKHLADEIPDTSSVFGKGRDMETMAHSDFKCLIRKCPITLLELEDTYTTAEFQTAVYILYITNA